MFSRYRLLLVITFLAVLLDQATKAWVVSRMTLYQSIPVIPNFFHLTYIRNPGAAFGILSNSGWGWKTAFFVTFSLIALVFLTAFYLKTPPENRLLRWAFSLVAAGAVGNLIDRIRWGEVVDFFDFFIGSYHWPAFNVADSCISVGIGLILYHSLTAPPDRADPGPAS